MNDSQKLKEIERVLFQYLIATETHEITQKIVTVIHGVIEDETFVMAPATMMSYKPKQQDIPVSVERALNDLKYRGYEDAKNTGVVLEHILKRLGN